MVMTATGGGLGPPPRGEGVAGRPGLMSVAEELAGEGNGEPDGAGPATLSKSAVWTIIWIEGKCSARAERDAGDGVGVGGRTMRSGGGRGRIGFPGSHIPGTTGNKKRGLRCRPERDGGRNWRLVLAGQERYGRECQDEPGNGEGRTSGASRASGASSVASK
jgi:hypothetical protein